MGQEFPRDAKDRVGMLFWRMHRAARLFFTQLHLKFTPSSASFLVDKVGHERANAEAEVRMFEIMGLCTSWPMIGGLQDHSKNEMVNRAR